MSSSSSSLRVSQSQKGNPVLKYIRNVHWHFMPADDAFGATADYMLGQSTAALFLSLRFHLLKPEYIHARMKALRAASKSNVSGALRSRVLVVQVDTDDPTVPLAQVTKAAIHNEFTLFCGFSAAECARYLETLKSYENKPAESIQKDLGSDYESRVASVLTVVRGVNKTDSKTLLSSDAPDNTDNNMNTSLAGVFRASLQELQGCAGIGPMKARRLHEACHAPFFASSSHDP